MGFVPVATQGNVDGRVVRLAVRLLIHEVEPALRRVLGRTLVLPPRLVVCEGGSFDGLVTVTCNPDGTVSSVSDPAVTATENENLLRFSLIHELAHYHEHQVRRAKGLRFLEREAMELWSEYFAQRVFWGAGFVPTGTGLDAWIAGSGAIADHPEVSYAYTFTWVRAHADVDPDYLGTYPPSSRKVLRTMVQAMGMADLLPRLYRFFPHWSASDVQALNEFFHELVGDSAVLEGEGG